MIELGVLFGLMLALAMALIFKLMRRGSGTTRNAEGLLIEQTRRIQAYNDRVSYNANTMHGSSPTMSDNYRS
ncbi:hypothetical protein [Streptomyces sp. NPDC005968]|uniref:hypothetical protein n=1 Tax=Streptomyces sp. NPDC005968 TaxID=3154574 RepID=UPI003401FFED